MIGGKLMLILTSATMILGDAYRVGSTEKLPRYNIRWQRGGHLLLYA
jgi:hypothetical protein